MSVQKNRIEIRYIHIGFADIVRDGNYADSHQPIYPFGPKWGRGVLIKGSNYIEAVVGPYGISHASLKNEMTEEEISCGEFYFGYDFAKKTLYLEYATDRTFDFKDKGYLDAIMNALKRTTGPFRDFIIKRS